ncbi:uncharacterized protein N7483_001223 [Penicillium malachiteum]|uniref:uncharacterized protein n=1 Tax=Penicillium malachiteum TaxID=1324776 RepID=UPI0025485305|nr:uncharacterized protein N7483_001223 [Penicillium malachiteum]KAJ5736098.1 hypothetical protein N7483_001223 [Penicillium malachiteum]
MATSIHESRMQVPSIPFSPVKDGRRILGDKDINACLSPVHRNKQPLSVTSTPVKRTLFSTTSPKKLLPSPIFAGQKRTRDQVDEVGDNGQQRPTSRGFNESSQSPPLNEKMDAQNTRVVSPTRSPRDGNQHMNTPHTPTTEDSKEEKKTIPEDPIARKAFIEEKAARLRRTLQTAMRNIPNNEIDRRVASLEEHSRKISRISLSTFSSSPLPTLSFKNTTTPKFTTPRIGFMPDMSSTPCQPTSDLPVHPSPLAYTTERVERGKASQRTPPPTLGSPMQLSSPPATAIRTCRTRDLPEEESGEVTRENMSPSQRGDAVDGLLKLMSTVDQNDREDAWSG